MEGSATFTMVVSSTIISTPEHSTYSAHQRLRLSSNMVFLAAGSTPALVVLRGAGSTAARKFSARDCVHLRGADEIVLVQPADGMRLVADSHVTPAALDVGMVILDVGDLGHRVHEAHGAVEV